jgi:hypothetical protein
VAAYPLSVPADATVDAQGSDYLGLVAGRLPDTSQLEPVLRSAIAPGGSLPPQLGVAAADVSAVAAAAEAWLAQLDSFALPPAGSADAWEPSRLEHQFSVTVGSASGPAFTLLAPAWPGRRLEWSDFDVAEQAATSPSSLPNLPGVDP